MTNCPKCGKPILNGGIFTSHARFTIRCPWCQSTLQINIQPKIVTEVIKLGNGNGDGKSTEPIPNLKEGEKDIARMFYSDEQAQQGNSQSANSKGSMKLVGYLYPEEDD